MRLDGSSSSSDNRRGLPVIRCGHQFTCAQQAHSEPPRRRCRETTALSSTRQATTLKSAASAASDGGGNKKRQLVLLSCSHLFHATCLQAMEEFTPERARHVCPVCRSNYRTKLVNNT